MLTTCLQLSQLSNEALKTLLAMGMIIDCMYQTQVSTQASTDIRLRKIYYQTKGQYSYLELPIGISGSPGISQERSSYLIHPVKHTE